MQAGEQTMRQRQTATTSSDCNNHDEEQILYIMINNTSHRGKHFQVLSDQQSKINII